MRTTRCHDTTTTCNDGPWSMDDGRWMFDGSTLKTKANSNSWTNTAVHTHRCSYLHICLGDALALGISNANHLLKYKKEEKNQKNMRRRPAWQQSDTIRGICLCVYACMYVYICGV
ncbi:unnamed protein product [Ceratitis capitata]|uniref:(Mediterranean fruit fly) hypothetical protein n=1 Tax=Ceratitis capitata TaxID=7213 RepID=A0A811VIW1_CERCA|nr:unnamed protein product [Ceratitis capitata]